ncbi:MAG: DNA polymerase III subunit alpha [Limisphaerales bacterium]
MPRVIVHLDADAFFASVEQAADSRLRGKPVAVGGEKRGIIASASYEARQFGVYTPMPTSRARKLCPKLILLPGDFDKYEHFSRWMFSYAQDFTPEVEIGSIDEGYFDLSAVPRPPLDVAETVRAAIRQALKITVSEGIASNKLVSQIASKLNKPAAFQCVPAGREAAFLHPLPNRWLPGVGPQTAQRLNAAGLACVRHIAATPTDLLHLLVGNLAPTLKAHANGVDERPVVPISAPARSYSQQQSFDIDLTDEDYAEAVLRRMADELMAKVRADGKSIRTLTVKVRYNDRDEDQRGESLPEPADLETDLYGRIHALFRQAWKRRVSLRMVSLKLSNVYNGIFRTELALERSAEQHAARRRLAGAIDELRLARGHAVVLRGHDLRLRDAPADSAAHLEREQNRQPATVTYRRARSLPPPIVTRYVPLNVRSCYSFLNSTLSIEAIVALAKHHDLPAIALADEGNLHGAVEFTRAAREAGIKPVLGAAVRLEGSRLNLYVENATGYRNLCRLLSSASPPAAAGDETDAGQHQVRLRLEQLEGLTDGLLALGTDLRLAARFGDRFYFAVTRPETDRPGPRSGLRLAAALPVRYAEPGDRWKFDIVQSIGTRTLLRQPQAAKMLSGQFHFRPPAEMASLFRGHPELLTNTVELAERCAFELPLSAPQFPAFLPPDGSAPRVFLRKLVLEGLRRRYGGRASQVLPQIEEELAIIRAVGYEEYFLFVWDILQECQRRGIDWITRGSAADSLVCYCLGISDVCPIRFDLYFRRFLNQERMQLNKLPDIDLDFAHDRKDDVVDLVFEKYGAEHAAVVGGFSTFQARSAVADVAKVLGVSEYQIRRFTEHFPWTSARDIAGALSQSQECRELPVTEEPYRTALQMAACLDGFPRHPKMHPCGVVLSRQPMHALTPTFISHKGYPTTHFDMDSVEAIGLVKIDILAQGGLAVMRDVKQSLAARGVTIDLRGLEPWEDPEVWEMIAGGGARAVHHIESPAMLNLCRMCNVREIDGLIAIVSVIRPGAANESKKLRFTRCYQGLEPVSYPDPSLEPCLKSTFGLVVYEEHILQICESFAGLPPGRADVLRRALAKMKPLVVDEIKAEFFASARARGHADEKIAEVWDLVSGFAGYAFCKAHSTAYGVEAYQAAWLKRYYPAEFMAAVLTHGKGFYDPLVYVLECHRLGIPMLPPWINQPGPQFTVCGQSIRVPATRVKGLTERSQERIIEQRGRGPFESLADFYRRVVPQPEEMEALIRVGAFDGFGRLRTAQFWESLHLQRLDAHRGHVRGQALTPSLSHPMGEGGRWPGEGRFMANQRPHCARGGGAGPDQGWLLPPPGLDRLPAVPLQEPARRQRLAWENELLGFTASGHPLELHDHVAWDTYCPVAKLNGHIGEEIVTCGLVIEQRTHHQVTGEPMKFLTLADRTGIVETELFADTYRSYGLATVRYPVLEIAATVEPFENGRGFSLRVHRAGKPRARA